VRAPIDSALESPLPSTTTFKEPLGIAVDPGGTILYVSDTGNCAIRVIHRDR
jgi:hypothetical protein